MPFRHRSAPGLKNFYVIAPITNPARFASRYRLFEEFRARMLRDGINLFVVEVAFGDRAFECNADLSLRTWDPIWQKERSINLAVQRLPSDWEYVAWIDADVAFCRDDWAEETVHQLQHHQTVQMFQNALDMGPKGEVMQVHTGFAWCWRNKVPPKSAAFVQNYYNWHPGYAWAYRREAWEALGGLIDIAILGAGDHHMAHALLGHVHERTPSFVSPGYSVELEAWQRRAVTHIREDIGYVPGTLHHAFHGPKRKRFYQERWDIIRRHQFDPAVHLKPDAQGLWQLTHEGECLRQDLHDYTHARDEDDIRVD